MAECWDPRYSIVSGRQGIRGEETSYEATEPPRQERRALNLENSRNGYKRLADTE